MHYKADKTRFCGDDFNVRYMRKQVRRGISLLFPANVMMNVSALVTAMCKISESL